MAIKPPVAVAIVNTNPDLVRILRVNIEAAGFVVFEIYVEDIKRGSSDIDALLDHHNPKVIVYDVAPPFDLNWRFLDHLRCATGFKDRKFVLTSVNAARVREIVGMEESVYEVAGRPDDIGAVVKAVKQAARSRPIR